MGSWNRAWRVQSSRCCRWRLSLQPMQLTKTQRSMSGSGRSKLLSMVLWKASHRLCFKCTLCFAWSIHIPFLVPSAPIINIAVHPLFVLTVSARPWTSSLWNFFHRQRWSHHLEDWRPLSWKCCRASTFLPESGVLAAIGISLRPAADMTVSSQFYLPPLMLLELLVIWTMSKWYFGWRSFFAADSILFTVLEYLSLPMLVGTGVSLQKQLRIQLCTMTWRAMELAGGLILVWYNIHANPQKPHLYVASFAVASACAFAVAVTIVILDRRLEVPWGAATASCKFKGLWKNTLGICSQQPGVAEEDTLQWFAPQRQWANHLHMSLLSMAKKMYCNFSRK